MTAFDMTPHEPFTEIYKLGPTVEFWLGAKSYRAETKQDGQGQWTVDYSERAMDPLGPWVKLVNTPAAHGGSADDALRSAATWLRRRSTPPADEFIA